MPRQFVYRVYGGTDWNLTQADQDNNILCIMDNMEGLYGWSKKAIAGMCGCFHEESHLNPGSYETAHGGNLNNLPYMPGGMGLGQWTDYPAYSGQNPNPLAWCAQKDNRDWWDGEFQCYLFTQSTNPEYTYLGLGTTYWGWLTDSRYPSIPFNDFITNTSMTVREATIYWFYDWEWHDYHPLPDWVDLEARVQWAEYAWQLMQGQTPDPPGPGPGPGPGPTPSTGRKMPLWMMLKRLPI